MASASTSSSSGGGIGGTNSRPQRDYAVVTLLMTDSYLPGALTCINSLLDVEPPAFQRNFDTVCLVTPSTVGHDTVQATYKSFDHVIGVEEIQTGSWKELDLLGRKDLAASLTKLHAFRLVQYKKILFLDADTLAVKPLSHLFNLPHPFSAAPDQGWPDAFNSGVFVAEPSEATFDGLMRMMSDRGTWDGGDQGLLNDFFPNWNRLSFTYNVTPSAYYTYAPAYKRHGEEVNVLHFIGKNKPWMRGSRMEYDPEAAQKDYYGLVNKWFDAFERHYGTVLTFDVATRVVEPPDYVKSYTTLPARRPSPTASLEQQQLERLSPPATAAGQRPHSPTMLTWDPARSAPPKDQLQMKEAITAHYDNIWDDPSKRKQKERFQPPERYPAIPKATHEWYKDVMKKEPDPSAVKPVFPWEAANEKVEASRQFPQDEPPRPLRDLSVPSTFGPSAFVPPTSLPVYSNAWDSVPGIGRYARSLARVTTKKERSSPEKAAAGTATDYLGGRKSSLKEPTKPSTSRSAASSSYERRSDASSRDGDDEDDEDEASEDDDRPKIMFRQRQGEPVQPPAAPTMARKRSSSSSPTSSTSPTGSAPHSPNLGLGGSLRMSPRSSAGLQLHTPPPPMPITRTSSGGSTPLAYAGGARQAHGYGAVPPPISPRRLTQEALRNSTATRMSASGSGNGDGPPIHRATRVFAPETDTAVVKKEGLAALNRFVETMEAVDAARRTSPPSGSPVQPMQMPSSSSRRSPPGSFSSYPQNHQ